MPGNTTTRKILIVDDEPDTITFLSAWLEDQGFTPCSAADGKQGMEAITREHPDLILLDIKMPNQTGVQLYRDIRLDESYRNLPVIFITGMAEYQIFDKECSPLQPPVACISKPIDLRALLAAIKSALG